MKREIINIFWLLIVFIAPIQKVKSQDIGATFCWHYNEIYGGHPYSFNKSIVTDKLPTNAVAPASKWEGMDQWWENMVEEVDYSGLDFVALLSRGTQPNQTKDLGMGDTKHIKTMVKYMKSRDVKFKLAIFDDCPNSWRGSRNYDLYAKDQTKYELFDCGNPDNYKYIWDYNLKLAIENMKITNLLGEVVYQEECFNAHDLQLNLNKKLPNSTYIISAESRNSKVYTKLIVR